LIASAVPIGGERARARLRAQQLEGARLVHVALADLGAAAGRGRRTAGRAGAGAPSGASGAPPQVRATGVSGAWITITSVAHTAL
jgi:hypothetical protein